MPNKPWLLVIVIVVAAAAACSSNDLAVNPCPVGSGPSTCGGFIGRGSGDAQISAVLLSNPYSAPAISLPETVHAGVPFTVTFYTVYGGCLTPDGESVVSRKSLTAIIPMETVERVKICPDWISIGPRSAQIALSGVGTNTVSVIGQGGYFGSSTTRDTVTANVVVLP